MTIVSNSYKMFKKGRREKREEGNNGPITVNVQRMREDKPEVGSKSIKKSVRPSNIHKY